MQTQTRDKVSPAVLLAAFALLLGVSGAGSAATPAQGTVSDTAVSLQWQGATFTAATNAGNVQGCFDAFGRPGIAMTTVTSTPCR